MPEDELLLLPVLSAARGPVRRLNSIEQNRSFARRTATALVTFSAAIIQIYVAPVKNERHLFAAIAFCFAYGRWNGPTGTCDIYFSARRYLRLFFFETIDRRGAKKNRNRFRRARYMFVYIFRTRWFNCFFRL